MDKTYLPNVAEIKRDWFVIDAAGMVLGRLATEVANILRGKNNPVFTPHLDMGDNVIIINCDKVVLTGKKLDEKYYRYHTGYPGGLKEIPYRRMIAEKPELMVMHAVRGMLPKNKLGDAMIKKLHLYAGPDHKHQAQQPQELKI